MRGDALCSVLCGGTRLLITLDRTEPIEPCDERVRLSSVGAAEIAEGLTDHDRVPIRIPCRAVGSIEPSAVHATVRP